VAANEKWASRFSEVRPTKRRERTDAQQAALDKATSAALGGLPMTGDAIEDGILAGASEQLKPLRVRQRHEAIRRERQIREVNAETDNTAEAEVEDFDPVAAAAELEREDAEVDEWLKQFEAEAEEVSVENFADDETDDSDYFDSDYFVGLADQEGDE
jgi:hypothetical protein